MPTRLTTASVPRDCSADSDVVKQIGLDVFHCLVGLGRNLRSSSIAHDDAHCRATSNKQRHQMAADKAGSAEHRNGAVHASSSLTQPRAMIIRLDKPRQSAS